MPQASDELRAKFPGCDSEALAVLAVRCVVDSPDFIIRPKHGVRAGQLTDREWDAIDYMIDEWDWGWSPEPATQAAGTDSRGK